MALVAPERSRTENDSQRSRLVRFNKPGLRVSKLRLAVAGFEPTLKDDETKCSRCKLTVKDWRPGHEPLAVHRAYAASICSFLTTRQPEDILKRPYGGPPSSIRQLALAPTGSSRPVAELTGTDSIYDEVDRESGNMTIRPQTETVAMETEESLEEEEVRKRYANFRSPSHSVTKKNLHLIYTPEAAPRSSVPDYTKERDRLDSFTGWPATDIVSPGALASAGFIYTGEEDRVRCWYCKQEFNSWVTGRDPMEEHREKKPECPFVRGGRSANTPLLARAPWTDGNAEDLSLSLGISVFKAKFPVFSQEQPRKQSFDLWDGRGKKPASFFIASGLFYTGQGDTVCCYVCGCVMSDWLLEEDIWVRHARTEPNCPYVRQERGNIFVEEVLRAQGRFTPRPVQPKISMVNNRMLRPRTDSRLARLAIAAGYTETEVREAYGDVIKYGRPDFHSMSELAEAIEKARFQSSEPADRMYNWPEETGALMDEDELQTTNSSISLNQSSATLEDPLLPTLVHPPEASSDDGDAASDFSSDVEHLEHVEHDLSPGSSQENPVEQWNSLQNQLTCKICLDKPVAMLFLPCGHMPCCSDCAPAMTYCPICRQDVKGRVQIRIPGIE